MWCVEMEDPGNCDKPDIRLLVESPDIDDPAPAGYRWEWFETLEQARAFIREELEEWRRRRPHGTSSTSSRLHDRRYGSSLRKMTNQEAPD